MATGENFLRINAQRRQPTKLETLRERLYKCWAAYNLLWTNDETNITQQKLDGAAKRLRAAEIAYLYEEEYYLHCKRNGYKYS